MPPRTQIKWIRKPSQDRSRRTLERILDAAERLVEKMPFDDVGVNQIVKKAKTSVGAFYCRFEGKHALLHAMHERYLDEAKATTEAFLSPDVWEGVPLRDLMHQLLSFLFQQHAQRAGLRRTLLIASTTTPEVRERSVDLAGHTCEYLVRLLETRADEIGHADISMATEVLHRIVYSVLDQNLLYGGSPTPHGMSSKEFVDELTDLCFNYLQADGE